MQEDEGRKEESMAQEHAHHRVPAVEPSQAGQIARHAHEEGVQREEGVVLRYARIARGAIPAHGYALVPLGVVGGREHAQRRCADESVARQHAPERQRLKHERRHQHDAPRHQERHEHRPHHARYGLPGALEQRSRWGG